MLASAQVDPLMVRSRSDQFVVYGMASAKAPRSVNALFEAAPAGQNQWFKLRPNALGIITNSHLYLEPGLVAVSCERIKEALLRELNEKESNSLRVYIQLNNRIRQHQTRIMADRYERGWMYGIEFPVELDEHFYSATILQVLLHELANRNSPDQQIDLPMWLLSGLTSHLQATTLQSLALQPNADFARVHVKVDPLAKVRRTFEKELPLSFEELSWPETLSNDRDPLFRDSAHLFVHQLLKLRQGRESLRRFIFELQHHRNWQFAFMNAFSSEFSQLVEVEKWWGLNFVGFMGRDASQLWSAEESWQQLKAALDVSMNVHFQTDRAPVVAEYNLQEAIFKWDYARQDLVLQKSLTQLRVLRFRTHPELRTLVDSYRKIIEKYLDQRSKLGRSTFKNENPINLTILKKNTCRDLDLLDDQRASLREKWLAARASEK